MVLIKYGLLVTSLTSLIKRRVVKVIISVMIKVNYITSTLTLCLDHSGLLSSFCLSFSEKVENSVPVEYWESFVTWLPVESSEFELV